MSSDDSFLDATNTPLTPVTDGGTPRRRSPAHSSQPSTPIVSSSPSIRSGISHTPLVFGTPRTPNPSSQWSPASSSNSVARGDIGRGLGRAIFIPPSPQVSGSDRSHIQREVPSTPNAWADSFGTQSQSQSSYDGLPGDTPRKDAPVEAQFVEQPPAFEGRGDAEVWGTNVNVQETANAFRHFINSFALDNDFEPYYQKQLEIIHRTEHMVLNMNCHHLSQYFSTRKLFKQLLQSPQEIIPIMDAVVNEIFVCMFGEREGQPRIQVRTFNLSEVSRMRALDPSQIENLIAIKGMVIRVSQVIPDLTQAFFRCCVCANTVEVLIDRGRIDDPSSCTQCQGANCMTLIHNRSLFMDKQLVRLQETPDEIPEGETPCTVSLCVYGDLVDGVRPGDRIEVTGIFRAIPRRINPKQRLVKSVYRTYVDVIHFKRSDHVTVGDDSSMPTEVSNRHDSAGGGDSLTGQESESLPQFSPERIKEFEEFALQGDVYNRLVNSFAPSIWEMDDVKRGVLCLLFGGTLPEAKKKSLQRQRADQSSRKRRKVNSVGEDLAESEYYSGQQSEFEETIDEVEYDFDKDKTRVKQRGDINILLCGDPGTSKSQMLSYVHKITPRGIYTSGKGSSAVGLTASVIKDPETKEMVLESGALVLSDNGICCIDEFDKMNETTRAILHEAMEQQTVSITKAGIIASLNARTSILASANPVESRYNARRSVVENIKLPPTLLSRFDLIYLVLDKPNPDSDRRLARHLVSLYYPSSASNGSRHSQIDQTFLKEYIVYARSNIAPEINDDAVEVLVRGYLGMRAMGGAGGKTIAATPRQLESLIRIAQALAKMRLSEVVGGSDVEEAIRLMKVATQTAATDPRTGTIDMDMITTGRTALDRDLVLKLVDELRSFFAARNGQRLTVGQIRQTLQKNLASSSSPSSAGGAFSATMAEIEEAVRELEQEGLVQYVERTQTVIVRSS